jgi:hypothetical protein
MGALCRKRKTVSRPMADGGWRRRGERRCNRLQEGEEPSGGPAAGAECIRRTTYSPSRQWPSKCMKHLPHTTSRHWLATPSSTETLALLSTISGLQHLRRAPFDLHLRACIEQRRASASASASASSIVTSSRLFQRYVGRELGVGVVPRVHAVLWGVGRGAEDGTTRGHFEDKA